MSRLAFSLVLFAPLPTAAFAQHAQVASLTSSGGSGQALLADLSRDGRWLAHSATADDPVAGDTNGLQDVWLRDLQTGARVRVSVDETGLPWTDRHAGLLQPLQGLYLGGLSVADAGERVAFVTVPATIPTPLEAQVRVFDRASGTSQLVSRTPGGAPGNAVSSAPILSGDGRHVVFTSYANDLVPNDTNNALDLFVRDLVTQATARIAEALPMTGYADAGLDVSANGRYVVHSRLVPGLGVELAEIDRDSDADGLFDEPGTIVMRSIATPVANEILALPSRSLDGRYVAFVVRSASGPTSLARLDRDTDVDGVFDEPGATSVTTIAACTSPPFESASSEPYHPSISSNGARIAWFSARVGPYFTEWFQVFVWDAATGAITLQSYRESTGECSVGPVAPFGPSLSGDGQRVVACMNSTTVVAGDPPGLDALVLRFDIEPVGIARYCFGAPNSVGPGARMGWTGFASRSQNTFSVNVNGCPPGTNGLFFYGPTVTVVPFGNGYRCVSGSLFRLGVQTTDAGGAAARQVRFDVPPADAGPGALLPGSSWNFNFYYRNPAAGGAGFNSSDALHVPIHP